MRLHLPTAVERVSDALRRPIDMAGFVRMSRIPQLSPTGHVPQLETLILTRTDIQDSFLVALASETGLLDARRLDSHQSQRQKRPRVSSSRRVRDPLSQLLQKCLSRHTEAPSLQHGVKFSGVPRIINSQLK